jgi:hypothetical protein
MKIFVTFQRVLRLYLVFLLGYGFWFPRLPLVLRVSKVLVYQRSSAQISGKKLVFLLVAALISRSPDLSRLAVDLPIPRFLCALCDLCG